MGAGAGAAWDSVTGAVEAVGGGAAGGGGGAGAGSLAGGGAGGSVRRRAPRLGGGTETRPVEADRWPAPPAPSAFAGSTGCTSPPVRASVPDAPGGRPALVPLCPGMCVGIRGSAPFCRVMC
ncbi:hypothetical protein GCM10009738_62170 [Kitasatospora viridis]